MIVELPEKEVTEEIVAPAEGEAQWWSGQGNSVEHTLTRTVDLSGAQRADWELTGWWDIEEEYDLLYAEAAGPDGEWVPLEGTAEGAPLPRDGADRPALHGSSDGHAELTYDLNAFTGEEAEVRFRYVTDAAVAGDGFTADEIRMTADGETVFEDGAEDGEQEWTADGFTVVGESWTEAHEQYYLVENRQYEGYDRTLENGPYNFGFATEKPDWVEHFGYQPGMLVWLWDTSKDDNNLSEHPGEGVILPVDAHPEPESWADDGEPMRNRLQARDATFSRFPAHELTLHQGGVATTLLGRAGAAVFDDRNGTYWHEENPENSVRVPDTGTRISVVGEPPRGGPIGVLVSSAE